ncbi:MAG: ABC transporter permease [Candidatus Helarchaeota archaeon]
MGKEKRFQGIKVSLVQTHAIIEKEITLKLRFPIEFFSHNFIVSIVSFIPLFFLYSGFLGLKTPDFFTIYYFIYAERNPYYYILLYQFVKQNVFGSLNSVNYLPWLLIGNIIYTFSKNGWDTFESKFIIEKYWSTIQGTLLAPVNRFLVLLGNIITSLIESMIYFIIIIIVCFIIYPISLFQILLLLLIASIMMIASGGIGLITGAIIISSENLSTIFKLFQFTFLFLSCFSIPFELFPAIFQDIITINPFYHGVELARSIYFGTFDLNGVMSLSYILVFGVITSVIGSYIFNKIWKKYGIHGY